MIILLLLTVLSVFVCYYIAKSRNAKVAKSRNAKAMRWAFLGAVFGPLALPFVFFCKPSKTP